MDIDPKHMARELPKLPKRRCRGHPDNLVRSTAAGFILMGYSAEVAIEKAKAVIEFYDWLFNRKE